MSLSNIVRPYYYGRLGGPKEYLSDWAEEGHELQRWTNTHLERSHERQVEIIEAMRDNEAELQEQTTSLRNIEETLRGGIEGLRSDFTWGFTLMVDRMDDQITLLTQTAERLDAIHKTLQSPLMTQASELFRLGVARKQGGLFDKALEAFFQSEQKNEVNFLLQLEIGKLLLCDVIDLCEAEKHLLYSARYAGAAKDSEPRWYRYQGEAYYHAGIAAYLIGEQEHLGGRNDGKRLCLERSLGYLAKANQLWPEFLDSAYYEAKCCAVLAKRQEAVERLQWLSDRDRRYFAKTLQDEDFASMRTEVAEVFRRSIEAPGPITSAVLADLQQAFIALGLAQESQPEGENETKMSVIGARLAAIRKALEGYDVDIVALPPQLDSARRNLKTIIDETLTQREKAIKAHIAALASQIGVMNTDRSRREALIRAKEEAMRATKGNIGIGCLFGLIVCVVTSGLVVMLVSQILAGQEAFNVSGVLQLLMGAFGTLVGYKLSCRYKNRHLATAANQARREIEAWERTVAPLVSQATADWESARRYLVEFLAWRTSRF